MVKPPIWQFFTFASVAAIFLTIAGGFYIWTHERLDYANITDNEIVRSTLPALAGLSIGGPWIPQFEELIRYTDREIPRGEGLLLIPGEDPFYYTTGRRPRFPVLMLIDDTLNPYGSEELLKLARAQKIRWLIVKRKLQNRFDPVEIAEKEARIMALLQQDFEPVKRLDNYDIYQRK